MGLIVGRQEEKHLHAQENSTSIMIFDKIYQVSCGLLWKSVFAGGVVVEEGPGEVGDVGRCRLQVGAQSTAELQYEEGHG